MPATSVRCSVPTSIDSFSSFFDFGTFSAVEHLGDAQIDLHEVVDRDPVVGRRGAAAARARPPARRRCGLRAPVRPALGASADRVTAVSWSTSSRGGAVRRLRCAATARRPSTIVRSPLVPPRGVASRRTSAAGRRLADAAQDLRGRRRHDRQQQDGRDAQRFGDVEQHLAQTRRRSPASLRQRPRLGLGDELVGRVDEAERRRGALVAARSRPSPSR